MINSISEKSIYNNPTFFLNLWLEAERRRFEEEKWKGCTLTSCIWRVAICIWDKDDQGDHISSNQTLNECLDSLKNHREDKNHPTPTLLHKCCNSTHLLQLHHSPNTTINSHTPLQQPNNGISSFLQLLMLNDKKGVKHGRPLCCFSMSLYI